MRYWLVVFLLFPFNVFNQVLLSPSEYKRQQILWHGEKYLGKPYRSTVGKHIFDCSGYVKFLMADIGITVTRSSVSQVHDGQRVHNIKEAKPGDIMVFKGRNPRNNRPGHVGIVHHWGHDTLYFMHSSNTKGVTIDHLLDPYYARRFLQVRDVIGNE